MQALKQKYDLELEKAIAEIKKAKAKRVCIQLADGLRPLAGEITDNLQKETGAEIIIWMGSCFGACDTPVGLQSQDIDLIIQWGHAPWSWL